MWIHWKGTNSKQPKIIVCLKLQKQFWVIHFFFSTKPHNCPHPNSTLYTLSKERVGRLKHFSISCMLPQNRATARCAVLKHQHCIQKNNFLPFYILQTYSADCQWRCHVFGWIITWMWTVNDVLGDRYPRDMYRPKCHWQSKLDISPVFKVFTN